MTVRRLILAACVLPALAAPAFAQEAAPYEVDVVEVVGPVDASINRYLLERIEEANERRIELLVLQVDSLGLLKVAGDQPLPEVVEAIRDSSVPVAVHIGPRRARAAGGVVAIVEAAHVAAIGPSSRIDLTVPIDLARTDVAPQEELREIQGLGKARGRPATFGRMTYSANEALDAGAVDMVSPSVAEMLTRIDGTTVTTTSGAEKIEVPKDLVTIRFWQPGPVRRTLHALANPALAYLLLVTGILMLVFEMSQPGFGVAGGTAAALLAGGAFGFSVLPAVWWAMGLLLIGSALMWLDVIRDELLIPTWTGLLAFGIGSVALLPRTSEATTLPLWVALATTAGAFIFFAPVMTLVKRQRRPITTATKRRLVGEAGQVRSMLNPEGYVMVGEELWRARLEPAGRLRVGEQVTITGVDGAVLIVAGRDTPDN